MYGTQTEDYLYPPKYLFENDVKMYGTQTKERKSSIPTWFENDVKMYGTQTSYPLAVAQFGLRMM